MRINLKSISYILVIILAVSCKKDDKTEFQNGYPNALAGNWIAFESPGGNIYGPYTAPFDLVTSLDPNQKGYLIIDKLYASDVRVRAIYDTTTFHVEMGEQLEKISKNTYNIAYISVDGEVSSKPILINYLFQLAEAYYSNISFQESDIKDVIQIHVGYYDIYKNLVDTTSLLGYRKTGFEDVSY
jgi:hypothetical protein